MLNYSTYGPIYDLKRFYTNCLLLYRQIKSLYNNASKSSTNNGNTSRATTRTLNISQRRAPLVHAGMRISSLLKIWTFSGFHCPKLEFDVRRWNLLVCTALAASPDSKAAVIPDYCNYYFLIHTVIEILFNCASQNLDSYVKYRTQ